jgi:protein-tyrosine-phosphatase
MAEAADLVLTASVSHRSFILDDRPGLFRRTLTLGQLDRMLDDLPDDLSGRDLLDAARAALKPPDPADDVPDPYGRGAEAASVAADRLVRLVTRAVDRLRAA